ncbi:MAG: hypothetical protein HOI96_08065 [Rhodospirillaceae bacterium]|nr:hypothetical protein [Rhodospirillaceae bacterium]
MNGLSRRILAVAVTGLFGFSLPAAADTPKVVNARIIKLGKTSYEFQVTVQHVDASWDHFADRWEIIGPGGRVLGTRVLYHPHIGERQFTRKLRGVTIPEGVEHVIVRVHDKLHGYGREKLIALPTGKSRDTGFK